MAETIHSTIHIKFCPTVRNYIESQVRDSETIRNNLVYYRNNEEREGRIYLFNSFTYSVEEIAKFRNWYWAYEVATAPNKVSSYARYFE